MTKGKSLLALAACLACTPGATVAQEADSTLVGKLVRIQVISEIGRHEGIVLQVGPEQLLLRERQAKPSGPRPSDLLHPKELLRLRPPQAQFSDVWIPTMYVSKAWAMSQPKRHVLADAGKVAASGALTMIASAYLMEAAFPSGEPKIEVAAVGAVAGAVFGGCTGAIVGLFKTRRWERIQLPASVRVDPGTAE